MPYTPRTPDEALTVACKMLAYITGDCPLGYFEGAPLDRCIDDCTTDMAGCWREWLLSGRPCETGALPPADLLDAMETAPGSSARRDAGAVPE
jgi:hypothetical protein